jgi:hypothetical protein
LQDPQTDLLHVRLAVCLTGVLPRSREDGEEDCRENSYDRYHHEQLDQRETAVPILHGRYPFTGSKPPGDDACGAVPHRLVSEELYLFIRILP